MKYAFIILSSCFLFSCSDAFIKHDMKFEHMGNCTGITHPVKLTSNINGQRYEFYHCTDNGFTGKEYTVGRKGDSLFVDFIKTAGKEQSLYKITLDIDAKPAYRILFLDGRELGLAPAQ